MDIQLVSADTSRRVDNTGRVVIPKSLRDKLLIRANDEVWFSSLEYDGVYYVCLTGKRTVDPKYHSTAKVLQELGVELPEELIQAMTKPV